MLRQNMKLNLPLKCSMNRYSTSIGIKGQEFATVLDKTFTKAYKPAVVENGVYDIWERNNVFIPKGRSNSKKFSLVLPPPNVTGTLHLGHALTAAIQDALARWHRMEGRNVVWVPGLDHAGIATQTVVERWLKQKKNVTRHQIGRDQFLNEVLNWKNEKSDVILHQLRRFGASLDWSREIFTMDPGHSSAVTEAVVRLWDAGLLYRRQALVNWSCVLSSAISDIEVNHVEVQGPTPLAVPGYDRPVVFGELTQFAYKVCGSDEEVVVSTTRPETMLGDVAVAVHPEDSRFTHLHGATLWHPLRNCAIPLVTDTMVDRQFGSGAVKITPGHSHVDWEVAQRHKLPVITVVDEKGLITDVEGNNTYLGMKRFDAREAIRARLAELGLLKGVKPHTMHVPVCSRSGDIVEHLLKEQWFVSCKGMAEKAADAVRNGDLQIEPANFTSTWFNWLDNIRDWCISRQLWWGHQIPMYLCARGERSLWVAARSLQDADSKASQLLGAEPDSITQDPDVLDTWFSSALYPLSAFGWPKQTEDMNRFYPLDVMETGHDILFFWVARMVMLGVELTGQLPFNKVLLHGIICDAQGRKMSKSLGNVINPEDVIRGISLEGLQQLVKDSQASGVLSAKEADLALQGQKKMFPNGIPECGTDALRFTLLSHNTKSHFISFDVRECETNHHFCNKIWQATRFTLRWAGDLAVQDTQPGPPEALGRMDRWVLSQLAGLVEGVTAALQTGDLHLATQAIKDFLYYKFCDVYVETTKPVLREGGPLAVASCQTLLHCLDVSLRLAAPFMPFISEQLFRHLPGRQDDSAMLSPFPAPMQGWHDPALEASVQTGLDVSSAVRSLKSAHGFYQKHLPVEIESSKVEAVVKMKSVIELLANCSLEVSGAATTSDKDPQTYLTYTLGDHTLVHINLQNISQEQYEEYKKTLAKKASKIEKALAKVMELKTKKGYEKRTDKEMQQKHSEQIKNYEEELRLIRSLFGKTVEIGTLPER